MSRGGGHIHHKPQPDPLVGRNVALHESTWKAIDAARGTQTSSAWIRDAIATSLYCEGQEGQPA